MLTSFPEQRNRMRKHGKRKGHSASSEKTPSPTAALDQTPGSPQAEQHHQHRHLNALLRLVHLTTFLVPNQDGHHKRQPPATTSATDDSTASIVVSPAAADGATTSAAVAATTSADEKVDDDHEPHTRFSSGLNEATRQHLRDLFRELCAVGGITGPLSAVAPHHHTLSHERFARFLAETQGETAPLPADKEHYRFEEFLEAWSFRYDWDAQAPPPPKDLTRSLANYFISSSHNTYLVGNQLYSDSSVEAYTDVGSP